MPVGRCVLPVTRNADGPWGRDPSGSLVVRAAIPTGAVEGFCWLWPPGLRLDTSYGNGQEMPWNTTSDPLADKGGVSIALLRRFGLLAAADSISLAGYQGRTVAAGAEG